MCNGPAHSHLQRGRVCQRHISLDPGTLEVLHQVTYAPSICNDDIYEHATQTPSLQRINRKSQEPSNLPITAASGPFSGAERMPTSAGHRRPWTYTSSFIHRNIKQRAGIPHSKREQQIKSYASRYGVEIPVVNGGGYFDPPTRRIL